MPLNYDVSLIINEETGVYPGDPMPVIEKLRTVSQDGYNLSRICICSHTGTHIDAPSHFFENKNTVDRLVLNTLIGKAIVIDFSSLDYIDVKHLQNVDIAKYSRVLFRTKNSEILKLNTFVDNYAYLTPEAGDYLIQKRVKLIGFDYYSLDKYNSDMPVHKKLLENDVIIVENLDLSQIQPGEYELLALPVKITTEGAPARVVLRQFPGGEIPDDN